MGLFFGKWWSSIEAWRGAEDSGMHTTVDDNPSRADNPSTLPYFPLFPLLQASVLQMTNSVFHFTKNIYSCSWIHCLCSPHKSQGMVKTRYSWIARKLLLENIKPIINALGLSYVDLSYLMTPVIIRVNIQPLQQNMASVALSIWTLQERHGSFQQSKTSINVSPWFTFADAISSIQASSIRPLISVSRTPNKTVWHQM